MITQKQCKIAYKSVLFSNSKSHTGSQSLAKSLTLNGNTGLETAHLNDTDDGAWCRHTSHCVVNRLTWSRQCFADMLAVSVAAVLLVIHSSSLITAFLHWPSCKYFTGFSETKAVVSRENLTSSLLGFSVVISAYKAVFALLPVLHTTNKDGRWWTVEYSVRFVFLPDHSFSAVVYMLVLYAHKTDCQKKFNTGYKCISTLCNFCVFMLRQMPYQLLTFLAQLAWTSNISCLCVCVWMLTRVTQIITAAHRDL